MEPSAQEHICCQCGRQYRSKSGYSKHMRKHDDQSPYKCCGKTYFQQSHFLRHRCNAHGEEKAEVCQTCDAKFPTKQDVRQHVRVVHERNRHQCEKCEQDFPSRQRLNDHAAKHEDIKPHVCGCGRSYQYVHGLSRHRKLCNQ